MLKRDRRARLLVLAAILLVSAGAGLASGAEPAGDGRYSMTPAEGGVIRLDKQTGAMSYCALKGASWTCEAMADGQQALLDENERLKKENERLEAEKRHLETMLGMPEPGGDNGAEGGEQEPKGSYKMPSEEDVDRMFDYLEGMLKKFQERMKRLEQDGEKGQPL